MRVTAILTVVKESGRVCLSDALKNCAAGPKLLRLRDLTRPTPSVPATADDAWSAKNLIIRQIQTNLL